MGSAFAPRIRFPFSAHLGVLRHFLFEPGHAKVRTMKILLTADLHIGRSSSGLPPSVAGLSIPVSCREAWGRIVEFAVREEVEAVLIAGDLVESTTAYYEALGPLVDGFKKLVDAGIDVFAVGGNHDALAFERIAAEVEGMGGVHFVGRRGAWERSALVRDGAERLFVDGWSFPAQRFPTNPGDSYPFAPGGGVPAIGLLHTDLDVAGSAYAPTSSHSLRGLPPRFWLLGHIHKPGLSTAEGLANILYPGSPQAMDFGETGPHGVWLLDAEDPGWVPVLWQVSTVRYEDSLCLTLSSGDEKEEIEAEILQASRRQLDALPVHARHALCCVVHRCAVDGEYAAPQVIREIEARLPELAPPTHEGVHICYQGVLRDRTRMPLDPGVLVHRGGALGELARRFQEMESGAWREAAWFADIHAHVLAAHRACPLEGGGEPPEEQETRDWLATQAKRLLVAAREGVA